MLWKQVKETGIIWTVKESGCANFFKRQMHFCFFSHSIKEIQSTHLNSTRPKCTSK